MNYVLNLEAFKKVIKEKKLTEDELAGFFNVKKHTIRRYIRGTSKPTIVHLSVFCRKVRIDIAELIIKTF